MAIYKECSLIVTGTPDSPQTVNYSDLADGDGVTLPTSFTSAPVVYPESRVSDVDIYLTEAPGVSSFKIAMSNIGAAVSSVVCTITIITITVPEITSIVDEPAITLVQMIALMNIYWGDTIKREFPESLKVEFLNQSQQRFISDLYKNHKHLLAELQYTDTDIELDSNGAFDITDLSYAVYNRMRGIETIRITDGEFCDMISYEEYKMASDNDFTFSGDDPKFYVRGSKFYILPDDTSDTVDIAYLRRPVQMAIATDPDDNTNCELNYEYQMIIIGLALEPFINRTDEARIAYESAVNKLNNIKLDYAPTDSITKNTNTKITNSIRRSYDALGEDDSFTIKFEYE